MRLASLGSVLVLALATATLPTGCFLQRDCTAVGYVDGLTVHVSFPSTPATYRLELEAEGEILGFRYTVPISPDSNLSLDCPNCGLEGQRIVLHGGVRLDESQVSVVVGRRDRAEGPSEVTARVYRDDALAAELTFEPRYDSDEPNGPGCGTHTFASASLTVP
jgi:hypothetical protein